MYTIKRYQWDTYIIRQSRITIDSHLYMRLLKESVGKKRLMALGIEPRTAGFGHQCSATELQPPDIFQYLDDLINPLVNI